MFQILPNELLSWLSGTRMSIVAKALLLRFAKTHARSIQPLRRGIQLDSNLAALPEMMAKTGNQLFRLDFKSLAYSQKGKDCYRPAAFNHLPVPDAEAVRNHILLAQLVFGSVGTDSVAKGTKEPRIIGRKVSVGAHLSRVRPTRAKTPRTKRRID